MDRQTGEGSRLKHPKWDWGLDMPDADEVAFYVATEEALRMRFQYKNLVEYQERFAGLVKQCEIDTANRLDVMDLHDAEWSSFRLETDITNLTHPAATDQYCPHVTALENEIWEQNLAGEFKTVHEWDNDSETWSSTVPPIHKEIDPRLSDRVRAAAQGPECRRRQQIGREQLRFSAISNNGTVSL